MNLSIRYYKSKIVLAKEQKIIDIVQFSNARWNYLKKIPCEDASKAGSFCFKVVEGDI